MEQLYHIPEDCEVELSIDHQRMNITVEGIIEEIDKANDKIFERLKKIQEELFLNEIGKQLKETIQWKIKVWKSRLIFSYPYILNYLIDR